MVEYLDPEIANEGLSANDWTPGAWTNAPMNPHEGEEYQPELEPPHINDYSAFKKHKHYKQYFRPYRFVPFPAWMYHPTKEPKLVKSREDVIALGPEWREVPFSHKVDMTGKSLPVKTETQKLAETVADALARKTGAPSVDPGTIAAIVAAVVAALPQQQQPVPQTAQQALPLDGTLDAGDRQALLDLAKEKGIKIDGRWSNDRIRQELGL